MKDDEVSKPNQQIRVVETTKIMIELKQKTPYIIELLEQERIDCNIDLFYIRRGFIKELYDKVFRGIPFWVPRGNFARWLKDNKPEIYQRAQSSSRQFSV